MPASVAHSQVGREHGLIPVDHKQHGHDEHEETLGLLQEHQREDFNDMQYAPFTDDEAEKGVGDVEEVPDQLHKCCMPLLLLAACILIGFGGWYLVKWFVAAIPGLVEWIKVPGNGAKLAKMVVETAGVVLLLVIIGAGCAIKARLLRGDMEVAADVA